MEFSSLVAMPLNMAGLFVSIETHLRFASPGSTIIILELYDCNDLCGDVNAPTMERLRHHDHQILVRSLAVEGRELGVRPLELATGIDTRRSELFVRLASTSLDADAPTC